MRILQIKALVIEFHIRRELRRFRDSFEEVRNVVGNDDCRIGKPIAGCWTVPPRSHERTDGGQGSIGSCCAFQLDELNVGQDSADIKERMHGAVAAKHIDHWFVAVDVIQWHAVTALFANGVVKEIQNLASISIRPVTCFEISQGSDPGCIAGIVVDILLIGIHAHGVVVLNLKGLAAVGIKASAGDESKLTSSTKAIGERDFAATSCWRSMSIAMTGVL